MDCSSTTGDRFRGCVIPDSLIQMLQSGQTSLSLLSLRYMEDEANDRGLNHEDTS